MRSPRSLAILMVGVLATFAGAQQVSNSFGGTFVDITTTGGTAITGVLDDSVHTITTTLGNAFLPAGSISISNNGVVSGVGSAIINWVNNPIPAAPATPLNISVGAGILMPHWDDLYPQPGATNTTLWWQEQGGVLYIQWNNVNHYPDASPTAGITFQVQVFNGAAGNCTPIIQYLYADTIFGGGMAPNDNGASATIGYAAGSIATLGNHQHSYNTANAVTSGAVLTLIEGSGGPFAMAATSPFGPGSLQLDWTGGFPCVGGTYFMAVTLAAGNFPTGWLYGLDISMGQLIAELNSGYPFLGPLSLAGTSTFGPIFGVPSGLQLWAVSLGIPTGGSNFTAHTPAITYTIP